MDFKTFCFDLDGTLCTNTEGAYKNANPYIERILEVNKLYSLGHTIIILTARGFTTGIDWRPYTVYQLNSWSLNYHMLYLSKPFADFYIDDKAVTDYSFFSCGYA